MLSTYAIRSLICFVSIFLLLIIYFSLSKPDYIKEYNKDGTNSTISVRLLIIYSLLYSSGISLVFMAIDVLYHYYFKNI